MKNILYYTLSIIFIFTVGSGLYMMIILKHWSGFFLIGFGTTFWVLNHEIWKSKYKINP